MTPPSSSSRRATSRPWKPQPTGYARITLDYNKKGLPVRMVLDEFAGIETEYTFKY